MILCYGIYYGHKKFYNASPKRGFDWTAKLLGMVRTGNTNQRGRLSTGDLLIKVACFVKK
jgi:hypothetical protein